MEKNSLFSHFLSLSAIHSLEDDIWPWFVMSDISYQSDKESYGEKDEDFNVEDYQDDLESDESFNDIINEDNKNVNISFLS